MIEAIQYRREGENRRRGLARIVLAWASLCLCKNLQATPKSRASIEGYLTATPPSQRALKFFDWVVEWAESKGFRGCPLQHTVSELTDAAHPARGWPAERRDGKRTSRETKAHRPAAAAAVLKLRLGATEAPA